MRTRTCSLNGCCAKSSEIRECVAELKEEIQEQQELVKDYEGNADGYLDMCRDACESFTAIMELLEAPRLNRNALKSVTRNAFNAIYKNL